MKEYKFIPLKDLVKRVKVGFVGSIEEFYCSEEGIPLIRTSNLTADNIDYSDLKYVTREFYEKNKKSQLHKGDLLIARHGDNGKANIYEKCDEAQALNVVIIEPDEKKLSSVLIKLFLETSYVMHQIKGEVGGSVQGVINTKKIAELMIPISNEIRYSQIDKLYTIIQQRLGNNIELYRKLDEIVKMTFEHWFLQYEFPDKNGKPYKSSGGEMEWHEEINREVPKGWNVQELGELLTSNRGISYNSSNLEGNGIPMVNLASFGTDGTYKEDGIKNYSGDYSKDKVLKPYDLVICNTQQTAIDYDKDIIGKAFLVPDIFDNDVVHSHHVTKITVNNDDFKFYLSKLFNMPFFHKYIAGFTNGTNILGLDFNGVETYKTEIPDDGLLKKFAELSLDIEMKKSEIIKENKELTSLRDFLLPLLMNGQVTFKD